MAGIGVLNIVADIKDMSELLRAREERGTSANSATMAAGLASGIAQKIRVLKHFGAKAASLIEAAVADSTLLSVSKETIGDAIDIRLSNRDEKESNATLMQDLTKPSNYFTEQD
jgi:hypothetical protein